MKRNCKYCNKQFDTLGLHQHEAYYCDANPNKLVAPRATKQKETAQSKFLKYLELDWNTFNLQVGHADDVLVRKRLYLEQEGRCNNCCRYEWQDKEIPLELEHKDGNHHNNSRENIEMLCPNCHALTPTWRGRNQNKQFKTVTDKELSHALKHSPSIRQALMKCGMAAKGNNYQRCHELMNKMESTPNGWAPDL